jgi:predicted adenine nucleotide alpha hydrolase (AANH) superfamily ATPase
VSPHKHSPTLFRIGNGLRGFVAVDFKKRDGFRRSMELARQYGLERQGYCGCEFSAHRPTGAARA